MYNKSKFASKNEWIFMKITQTFGWSILIGCFLYWWIFILINAVCIIFVSRHLKDSSLHILLLFFWQFCEPRCGLQNILGVLSNFDSMIMFIISLLFQLTSINKVLGSKEDKLWEIEPAVRWKADFFVKIA